MIDSAACRVRRTCFALAALVGLVAALPAAGADERWMVVMLDGRKLGHAVERESVDAQGHTVTSAEMMFGLERMGEAVSLGISTEFIEAKDGTPLKMASIQKLGATKVVERYEFIRGFAGDEVIQLTESQGRTTRRQRPWPEGAWLTPVAARREVEQRLGAGEAMFTVTTLDPTVGLAPVATTYTVVGPVDIEVLGKTVPSVRWTVTQSAMPGVTSSEYVDARGRSLRSEIELGGMKLTLLAADKDVATSPFDPPEMMARTLVTPSGQKIEGPRSARRASYVLSLGEGDVGVLGLVPGAGSQRVLRLDDRRVRVMVEAGRASPAGDDAKDGRYMAASTMIDSNDPMVRQLAMDVQSRTKGDARQRAVALREAVSDHIRSAHLGVGLATASEVVRTRTGDCTEYAVLLAAVLRAAEIPSRVVSGVVFVDTLAGERRVFGYHMWAQAIVPGEGGEPEWIDLDSAIPTPELGGIDATHIALAVTSLSDDDSMGSMAAMVGVLGRLAIEVERVER